MTQEKPTHTPARSTLLPDAETDGYQTTADGTLSLAISRPQETDEDPMLGLQVGNFRIVSMLGKGGFGAVYKAEQIHIKQPFAIKVLHLTKRQSKATVARFQREAKALARLRHDYIVQLMDFGELDDGSGFYLVMEYLQGKTLAQRLLHMPPLSIFEIENLIRQLSAVLGYAHRQGIVHRDIKPSNVFLLEDGHQDGRLKLIDFGIASAREQDVKLTREDACMGSPAYMSPEQARGKSHQADGRSDLYSLGIILFQMLTGTIPFRSSDLMGVLYEQVNTPPPSLAQAAPTQSWTPQLEAFLQRALAKEPDDRFPDAGAFWRACAPALDAQRNHKQRFAALPTPYPGPPSQPEQPEGPAAAKPTNQVEKKQEIKQEIKQEEKQGTKQAITPSPPAPLPLQESPKRSHSLHYAVAISALLVLSLLWFLRSPQHPTPGSTKEPSQPTLPEQPKQPKHPTQVERAKKPAKADTPKALVTPKTPRPAPKAVVKRSAPRRPRRRKAAKRARSKPPRQHKAKNKKGSHCPLPGWRWLQVRPFLAQKADISATKGKLIRYKSGICISPQATTIGIEQPSFVPCVFKAPKRLKAHTIHLQREGTGSMLLESYCFKQPN